MRAPGWLALLGAVLVAVAPFVPIASNHVFAMTCSLAGIARESFRSPGDWRQGAGVRPGGCGLRALRDLVYDDDGTPSRFDGRIECGAFFALALLAAAAAIPRWTRHAWIVGVVLAAVAGWTWWALRAEIAAILLQLPGGLAALPRWLQPWPYVLAGCATLSLAIASLWTRRHARRASDAAERVPKIFE